METTSDSTGLRVSCRSSTNKGTPGTIVEDAKGLSTEARCQRGVLGIKFKVELLSYGMKARDETIPMLIVFLSLVQFCGFSESLSPSQVTSILDVFGPDSGTAGDWTILPSSLEGLVGRPTVFSSTEGSVDWCDVDMVHYCKFEVVEMRLCPYRESTSQRHTKTVPLCSLLTEECLESEVSKNNSVR